MSEDIEQIYKRTEQYGRMQFVKEIDKLQCEKQQLIKFLENKINDVKDYAISFGLFIDEDTSNEIDTKIKAYQEVLDFVRGGKDE